MRVYSLWEDSIASRRHAGANPWRLAVHDDTCLTLRRDVAQREARIALAICDRAAAMARQLQQPRGPLL